jgi:hypothetical protein
VVSVLVVAHGEIGYEKMDNSIIFILGYCTVRKPIGEKLQMWQAKKDYVT